MKPDDDVNLQPIKAPRMTPKWRREEDRRIAKLMQAIARRFPGTTMITGPMPDDPYSGETRIKVLNAPDPYELVWDYAYKKTDEIWGERAWITAMVSPVNRENTAKYYSQHLPKPASAKPPRRRRSPAAASR